MTRHHSKGFSLLEAIVAMVVMATCLLALYGWLSSNTIALQRVQAQTYILQDARTALALVSTVNPMSEPRGERELGSLSVRWTSEPVVDRRMGMSRAAMATPFDFTLYTLQVEVLRDGRPVREFSVRKAGWEATRAPSLEDL